MQTNRGKDETKTGTFNSMTRHQSYAKIVTQKTEEEQLTKEKKKLITPQFFKSGGKKKTPSSYSKLIRSAAACAVLALGVWGIRSMDTGFTNQISNGIDSVTSGELDVDDDTGRLKFVNEDDSETLKTNYSLPLDGEVIETFSESEKDVKIMSEDNSEVRAILSGTVIKTSSDEIIVENDNGTRTTYTGLEPIVSAGDKVSHSDTIGQLNGEILCLETISGIGYVDSLDAASLGETVPGGAS